MTEKTHKPQTLQEALDVIDRLNTQALIQSGRIAELEQLLKREQSENGSRTTLCRLNS